MSVVCSEYGWKDAQPTCAHEYILPAVQEYIQTLYHNQRARIVDMGCGNGHVASSLARLGHSVIALDASPDGIRIARSAHPQVEFMLCSVYDDNLLDIVGDQADCVLSLEVVEHLFYPNKLFEQSYRLLKSRGHFIVTTPYHGYLKNLSISLVNGWDRHFDVERNGGHIKFFSKKTLAQIARKAGFRNLRFAGLGRLPWLWKSIIMVAEK